LNTRGLPVFSVRFEVHGIPAGVVGIHSEQGEVLRHALTAGDGSRSAEWVTSAAETAFVRVEVRHPDGGMAALTNPVILA
jgi:hypothetical protein